MIYDKHMCIHPLCVLVKYLTCMAYIANLLSTFVSSTYLATICKAEVADSCVVANIS